MVNMKGFHLRNQLLVLDSLVTVEGRHFPGMLCIFIQLPDLSIKHYF